MAKRRKQTKLVGVTAEFVRWARVCRVATVSAEGVPHLIPVCHVLVGQKLYFASGKDGAKIRNLNPTSTLAGPDCWHFNGLRKR